MLDDEDDDKDDAASVGKINEGVRCFCSYSLDIVADERTLVVAVLDEMVIVFSSVLDVSESVETGDQVKSNGDERLIKRSSC